MSKIGRPSKAAQFLPPPVPALPDYGRGIAALAKFGKPLGLPMTDDWEPYTRQAELFRKHHIRMLAIQAGGSCGAAPSTMVTSAATQMAVSQYMFDRGTRECDLEKLRLATSMANDSRQNLLAAYQLAVREAEALKAVANTNPTNMLEQALKAAEEEQENDE